MEWSKVKNIIILILLLLNGFLLVLVLGQRQAVREYNQSALSMAVQVLEQNGISLSESMLKQSDVPSALTATRDLEAEAALVRAAFGEDASATDQGGGLYSYESASGTAIFRVNGDFSMEFADCRLNGKAPQDHAAALLKDMGLTGELLSAPPQGESGEVVYCQTLDGMSVYTCRLVFQYDEDRLLSLNGTVLAGAAQPTADAGNVLDLSNVLIRFLGGVLERGDVCSEILELRPGYRLTQSFVGSDSRLDPVWLVSTNVGNYFLDGVTGALEPAE